MLSPENTDEELSFLLLNLCSVERRLPLDLKHPKVAAPVRKMSVRDAVLGAKEKVKVEDAVGRVVSTLSVGCPPAVPIVISGELVTEETAALLKHYGVDEIFAVKE